MEPQQRASSLSMPIAIVIAGLLIAGAIFLVNRDSAGGTTDDTQNPQEISIAPVTAEDHILGNPNAPVKLVEYSDLECPFCKSFQSTMHAIMDEFGKDGQVAWVYRHFPLTSIHPKAQKEAEATECVAELGGNEKFWEYIDKIYEVTPSNNGLDLTLLPKLAADIGINRTAFETCLSSGKYTQKVQDQFDEVVAAGGRGTPHTIILVGDQKIPVEGAQPLAAMRAVVRTVLSEEDEPGTQAVPTVNP